MRNDWWAISAVRHRVGSAFGAMSAVFSFICVSYLCAFLLIPVYAATIGLGFVPKVVGLPLSFAVAMIGSMYAFMANGRFVLRSFPPRLQGKPRYIVLGFAAISLVSYTISVTLYLFAGDSLSPPHPASSSSIAAANHFADFYATFNSPAARAGTVGMMVGWIIGFIFPLLKRNLKPKGFVDEPFIVFLRRFSTFSDREVVRTVLKGSPSGTPVAFLTPTGSRAGDWNPFLIGFAGMKLRRPFKSMPLVLRSTDANWRDAAELLIRRADKIVLDLSKGSGAIGEEIEMIEHLDRWTRTIILTRKGQSIDDLIAAHPEFATCHHIEYRQSWFGAMLRMFGGMWISLLVAIPLFLLLPMLMTIIVSAPMGGIPTAGQSAMSPGMVVPDPGQLLRSWQTPLVALGWLYVFITFFLRPVLSRRARKALRTALRINKIE